MIIKKDKWIGLRISTETKTKLQEIANEFDESIASTVRKIIKYYLEMKKK